MSEIYGNSQKKLKVDIPKIQQHPNSNDYGPFAAAHMVEFCHSQSSYILSKCDFAVSLMRTHLLKCSENEY